MGHRPWHGRSNRGRTYFARRLHPSKRPGQSQCGGAGRRRAHRRDGAGAQNARDEHWNGSRSADSGERRARARCRVPRRTLSADAHARPSYRGGHRLPQEQPSATVKSVSGHSPCEIRVRAGRTRNNTVSVVLVQVGGTVRPEPAWRETTAGTADGRRARSSARSFVKRASAADGASTQASASP